MAEESSSSVVHCRHCGAEHYINAEIHPDWLCPDCGRYQDATTCPTCGSLTRISMLPEGMAPAPAKAKRAKEKE